MKNWYSPERKFGGNFKKDENVGIKFNLDKPDIDSFLNLTDKEAINSTNLRNILALVKKLRNKEKFNEIWVKSVYLAARKDKKWGKKIHEVFKELKDVDGDEYHKKLENFILQLEAMITAIKLNGKKGD